MIPTLDYLKEKFEYYNKLCFDGALPMPPMKLNMRNAIRGITHYSYVVTPDGKKQCDNISIEISVRKDLPEEVVISTLVHEMIHYYIAYNGIVDDSPHGAVFQQKMQEINNTHGLGITITYDPDEETLIKSISCLRYICVAEFDDDRMGVAVVAKNKICFWLKVMPQFKGIKNVRWYISNRAIFQKYPISVTPKIFYEDADKIYHYLDGAVEIFQDSDSPSTVSPT